MEEDPEGACCATAATPTAKPLVKLTMKPLVKYFMACNTHPGEAISEAFSEALLRLHDGFTQKRTRYENCVFRVP